MKKLLLAFLLSAAPALADVWILIPGSGGGGGSSSNVTYSLTAGTVQDAIAGGALAQMNAAIAAASELSYPVFCLPIGDSWVDYILKASTNNFTNICYYVRSTATNEYTTDTNVWAYFTDDYSPDIRAWHYSPPGVSIYSQLANPTYSRVSFVMVYPSHDALGWTNWMSSTNTSLVWAYARCDAISIEMNQTGTKEHWSPCAPIAWQSQRTRP